MGQRRSREDSLKSAFPSCLTMMADVIALRAALTRMGFRPARVTFITDTQSMNNLEEFCLLDDDTVQNLCKAIRQPGGMMETLLLLLLVALPQQQLLEYQNRFRTLGCLFQLMQKQTSS